MRIHLLSDLHLEFCNMPKEYTPPECDVVVLSGDISPGLPGLIWAQNTFTVPVIYVLGNHEFYGMRAFHKHVVKMRAQAQGSNVTILHNETMEIDGVRFIGTTLWTDFELYGQGPMHEVFAGRMMSDYRVIRHDYNTPITPFDTRMEHQMARQFIVDELHKPFDGKTVVCTHHAPSERSVHPRWHMHPCTPAYASRLDPVIEQFEPVLWTHGHVHNNFDYTIGKTRVVANPRGYKGPKSHENNEEFNDQLVLEI